MKRLLTICAAAALVLAISGLARAELVSYWPFDEGADTIAYDNVGTNDGAVEGATWITDGAICGALQYDLSEPDKVVVPDDDSLEPAAVSVAAWVKSDGTPGYCKYIVAKHYQLGYASYGLYTGGPGGLYFYVSNGGFALSPGAAAAEVWDNEWHHIVGTYDGAYLRLYVDGVEVGGGTACTKTIGYDDGDLYIGSYGAGYHFDNDGSIDEVAIWSHALSAEEVLNVYMHGAPAYGVVTSVGAIQLESEVPVNLTLNIVESDDVIRLYEEQWQFQLGSDLAVDINSEGIYGYPDDLTGGTIAEGTWVNCYLIHADRTGVSPLISLEGSITFENEILGVIVTTDSLDSSDEIVGRLGTTYELRLGSLSGLELNGQDEVIVVDGSTVTIDVGFADRMDEVRVITAPSALEVAIDIKPGSECGDDNTISLDAQGGLIPVAILSDCDSIPIFDATTIDPATVSLEGADVAVRGKGVDLMAQEIDVNGDGCIDLVIHIAVASLIEEGAIQDGEAMLTGLTTTCDGQLIVGWDDVTVVPVKEGE